MALIEKYISACDICVIFKGPFPRGPGERRGPYRPEEEYGSGGFEGTRRFFPNGGGPRNYHSEDRGFHAENVHFPTERRAGPTPRRVSVTLSLN